MVRAVLIHDPPLEARDRDFDSPPLGWAIHGAMNGWPGISTGAHGACVQLLLEAGATCPESALPIGDEAIDRVLRAHLRRVARDRPIRRSRPAGGSAKKP